MKGAEAYVNDQWATCGLAGLPSGPQNHCVTLHFVIPRDAQYTGLIQRICEAAEQRLRDSYPGRPISHEPIEGAVVGDGTGDGINLVYHVGPLP